MSTQLEDKGDHWIVSTVVAPGKRKKMSRSPVRVEKGDKAALMEEIVRQARAARVAMGLEES